MRRPKCASCTPELPCVEHDDRRDDDVELDVDNARRVDSDARTRQRFAVPGWRVEERAVVALYEAADILPRRRRPLASFVSPVPGQRPTMPRRRAGR